MGELVRQKLGLYALVGALFWAAGATPARANDLFAIEQLDAEAELLVDSRILQGPRKDAPQVAFMMAGARLIVTGKVRKTPWYRVATRDGHLGFISGDAFRDPPGAARASSAAAPTGGATDEFQDCPTCPKMVALSPGSFTMGSNDSEISERPAHRATIRYRFAIGKHEVTVAQWAACASAGACTYKPKPTEAADREAMRNLSWEDAQQYVQWLSKTTGKTYRLPTEAEWEYAARGGTRTAYWWGDEPGAGNASCDGCGGEWNAKRPPLVGGLKPNPFGLHDMNGGVAEWTADCYARTYKGVPTDGSAFEEQSCLSRVVRGGSWRDKPDRIRSTSRTPFELNLPNARIGLRVAMTLADEKDAKK